MANFSRAFTLIEVLVVATIIGLLAAGGVVFYTSFAKEARDSRRKADIEQIRAALEMYRSNSATSAYPPNTSGACSGLANDLVSGSTKYIGQIPTDPVTAKYGYYCYVNASGSTYTLGVFLENGSTNCAGTDCDAVGTAQCKYTVDPYGQTCP